MFAALDGSQHRWVRILVFAPERSEELEVPASLEELAARIQLYPARPWLDEFARRIAQREKRQGRSVTKVSIELWRTDYKPRTFESNAHRLAEHTLHVD
jgi:hypothetical protein